MSNKVSKKNVVDTVEVDEIIEEGVNAATEVVSTKPMVANGPEDLSRVTPKKKIGKWALIGVGSALAAGALVWFLGNKSKTVKEVNDIDSESDMD